MKKILLFTLMFYLTFINSALAHTGLESSVPQNGDIIKEELKQITMTFETKVEQGSIFELQTSIGEPVIVENIALSENQMVGTFSSPLKNGVYLVNWKIIGADGHPIEGEFSFSVDMPVSEAPVEDQVEPQEEAQPQPKGEDKKIDSVNETETEEIQQNKIPSYVIPVILGILLVIVVGSFLFILKRKR
ncbi:copper resistance CopC family protein [Bacillus marasmi]|uniref:copper resistance CopC family protein n=1 Tax=Bacillus marasmi TaxID=1926279 RepID=UPI0011C7F876|nr:copper resistance CopC family protein [Bacillus marasmi]